MANTASATTKSAARKIEIDKRKVLNTATAYLRGSVMPGT